MSKCQTCKYFAMKSEAWLYCVGPSDGCYGTGDMIPCCTFGTTGAPIDEDVKSCRQYALKEV